jgi:glucokinase
MKRLVLAADVGGTKSDFALFNAEGTTLSLVREERFASAGFPSLVKVVETFLRGEKVMAAAFGIPGPVIDEKVVTTNLPWGDVRSIDVARLLGLDSKHVVLMNDLETTAFGALFLPQEEFQVLNAGVPRRGNGAVIAAGTGLGQALLYWDGKGHRPSATEGGHTDFAPRGEIQGRLLHFLERKLGGRVSYERVCSGPGLHNVYEFLVAGEKRKPKDMVREEIAAAADPSAAIGIHGVAGSDAVCSEALEIFVDVYGAQAGNLALSVMATGGVYIGGGIVTKIFPKMIEKDRFMRAFTAKGRYERLMGEIPVAAILNPRASRVGAAMAALRALENG